MTDEEEEQNEREINLEREGREGGKKFARIARMRSSQVSTSKIYLDWIPLQSSDLLRYFILSFLKITAFSFLGK